MYCHFCDFMWRILHPQRKEAKILKENPQSYENQDENQEERAYSNHDNGK
jgi:hypothetical protein